MNSFNLDIAHPFTNPGEMTGVSGGPGEGGHKPTLEWYEAYGTSPRTRRCSFDASVSTPMTWCPSRGPGSASGPGRCPGRGGYSGTGAWAHRLGSRDHFSSPFRDRGAARR